MAIIQGNSSVESAVGGYEIPNSLRFNSADSAYLSWTPSSASNQNTATFSVWVKLSQVNFIGYGSKDIYNARTGTSSPQFNIRFLFYNAAGSTPLATDELNLQIYQQGMSLVTSQIFRDPSAWYHIVVAFDSTQATDTNRVKLYVNGSQVTAFQVASYPAQNFDFNFNAVIDQYIGRDNANGTTFDGYMADFNFIDGQQLTPSDFGEFNSDTGVWQPKKYSGSYGTNGFYLPMTQEYETLTADFLVIAGGASGGGDLGAGGGAGGYREFSAQPLILGAPYTVTVGAGGSGVSGYSTKGNNGNNSVLGSITSTGGGGGGVYRNLDGIAGGSGGGGGRSDYSPTGGGTGGAGNLGGYTPVEGYAGGSASAVGGYYNAAGGGGAGGVGQNPANDTNGAAGGVGVTSSITGSAVGRAGGGGGYGAGSVGSASDGGGAGGGTSGSANTGGGGGGGSGSGNSGSGGSGVVIIKIPDTNSATFSGGVTSSVSTAVSGYKIYTVTATSTTSETVTFS